MGSVDELPQGWFGEADIHIYRTLANLVPCASSIAELGVWRGRSLCSIADIVIYRGLHVYAVDTFLGTPGDSAHDEARNGADIRAELIENLSKFGVLDFVTILTGPTGEMVRLVPDASLSLILMDADHCSEVIQSDIRDWLPKLTSDGVMIGHDWSHDSVRQGVRASGISYHEVNDNIWAYRPNGRSKRHGLG